jgi:UDP-glucose 6-dehydrogenase
MRVTMIGAGYVGLVSGACFADFGHHVTCVDKDAGRIAALRRGEIPIFEPGLVDLVATNIQQGGSNSPWRRAASAMPMPCSSPSARHRAAAMATPI